MCTECLELKTGMIFNPGKKLSFLSTTTDLYVHDGIDFYRLSSYYKILADFFPRANKKLEISLTQKKYHAC